MWAVRLTDPRDPHAWGPFTERRMAEEFAAFVTREIDPAEVVPAAGRGSVRLRSPVSELLSWRNAVAIPARAELAQVRVQAQRLCSALEAGR